MGLQFGNSCITAYCADCISLVCPKAGACWARWDRQLELYICLLHVQLFLSYCRGYDYTYLTHWGLTDQSLQTLLTQDIYKPYPSTVCFLFHRSWYVCWELSITQGVINICTRRHCKRCLWARFVSDDRCVFKSTWRLISEDADFSLI